MSVGAYAGGFIALILLGRLVYWIFTHKPTPEEIKASSISRRRKIVALSILGISIGLFIISGTEVISINFMALASVLLALSFGVAII